MLRYRSAPPSSSLRLRPHDHMAFLCGKPEHWRGLVASFAREGLGNNERCLYLLGLYRPQQVYALLDQEGVDVGDARQADRLLVEAATEYFLADGCLDIEAALAKLAGEVKAAMAQGRAGLRLFLDMNWATYFSGGLTGLLECERQLNDLLLPHHPCLAVCHYERVLFPPKVCKLVASMHRLVLDGDRMTTPMVPVAPSRRLGAWAAPAHPA